VDRAVLLDSDGLPFVPAKTLVGLLRHRSLSVVSALSAGDEGTRQAWLSWHFWLFGSTPGRTDANRYSLLKPGDPPIPSALTTSALRLSAGVRRAIADVRGDSRAPTRDDVIAAARVVRPGIAIDPTTGTAKQDFFRVEEFARTGLTVVSDEWALEAPQADQDCEISPDPWEDIRPGRLLLHCAAGLINAVGGRRRRGHGVASVVMDGLLEPGELDEFWQGVSSGPMSVNLAPLSRPMEPISKVRASGAGDHLRHVADLDIVITTPVIVAPTVSGNIVETATYIPAASLFHVLSPAFAGQLDDLIRQEMVRLTPAYPVVSRGASSENPSDEMSERCVPWPLSLGKRKHPGHGEGQLFSSTFEVATVDVSEDAEASVSSSEMSPLSVPDVRADRATRNSYLALNSLRQVSVPTRSQSHAVIDERPERRGDTEQAPFDYVGLRPGSAFRAELWMCEGKFDENRVPAQARIGTSRKDDYGQVSLTVHKPPSSTGPLERVMTSEPVALLATSDWLLLDDRGAPATTADGVLDYLRQAYGPDIQPGTTAPMGWSAMRVRKLQSWQATWSLPRPDLVSIAAGSVFFLVASDENTVSALMQATESGVGERRAEGFGRLRVLPRNLLTARDLEISRGSMMSSDDDLTSADTSGGRPGGTTFTVLMEAAWRAAIDRAAARFTHGREDTFRDLLPSYEDVPSSTPTVGVDQPASSSGQTNSQLGALRGLILGGDSEQLAAWIDRNGSVKLKGLRSWFPRSSGWDLTHPMWSLLTDDQSKSAMESQLDSEVIERLTRYGAASFWLEGLRRAAQAKQGGLPDDGQGAV
jgi:CRISPR-associated protein Csx10